MRKSLPLAWKTLLLEVTKRKQTSLLLRKEVATEEETNRRTTCQSNQQK